MKSTTCMKYVCIFTQVVGLNHLQYKHIKNIHFFFPLNAFSKVSKYVFFSFSIKDLHVKDLCWTTEHEVTANDEHLVSIETRSA